jgi:hypothetical protein
MVRIETQTQKFWTLNQEHFTPDDQTIKRFSWIGFVYSFFVSFLFAAKSLSFVWDVGGLRKSPQFYNHKIDNFFAHTLPINHLNNEPLVVKST